MIPSTKSWPYKLFINSWNLYDKVYLNIYLWKQGITEVPIWKTTHKISDSASDQPNDIQTSERTMNSLAPKETLALR